MSDNASDIAKALRGLGEYPWIGCAAHTINLVVQAGLKEPVLAKLVGRLKEIVTFVKKSNNASNQLRKFHRDHDLPDLAVIQEVETRWNSAMIERQIKLKEGLNRVMSDIAQTKHLITLDDMHKMNTLIDLLRHFKGCHRILSCQNYPTSSRGV